MTYKDSQRRQTEARVREKDAAAARRRNAELDQELDERVARDRLRCDGCGQFMSEDTAHRHRNCLWGQDRKVEQGWL